MGKVVKAVGNAVGKVVKSVTKAPFDAIKSIGRGDINGVLDAATRMASAGTLSLSNKGLINPASVAKTLGVKTSTSAPTGAVVAGMTGASKKKGLLSQLRQGKGGEGGGSFTSVAKDPLGGESGKTGK